MNDLNPADRQTRNPAQAISSKRRTVNPRSGAILGSASCLVAFVFWALHPAHRHTPMRYEMAINASASNSFQLGLSIYLASRLAGMIDTADFLNLYRVDVKSIPLPSGPAPTDTMRFQADLVDSLQALAVETGTHSLGFWEKCYHNLTPKQPVTLIYFTDGFEEQATDAEIQELRATGKLLAASKSIRSVCLLGVNPRMNALWNSVFHDMGNRFHMYGPVTRSSIGQIEAIADANN